MLLRICLLLLFTTSSLIAGQSVTRPNLNGLEKGEGKRRAIAVASAQARLDADNKVMDGATKDIAAAQDAKSKTEAQQRLTEANQRLPIDQKALANAQARQSDWTSTVLKSHQAPDGAAVDWTKATITSAP